MFVIIFTVELEELRELWLIGAETMKGWEGKEEKRRKCVDFSPNRCGKYLTSQDV
jgi:hypothetical protein